MSKKSAMEIAYSVVLFVPRTYLPYYFRESEHLNRRFLDGRTGGQVQTSRSGEVNLKTKSDEDEKHDTSLFS